MTPADLPPLQGECIKHAGRINDQGYGRVQRGKRSVAAHVVAWEQKFGPVPDGKVLDHLCRNRACVNPDHLEPVTNKENILRGVGPTAVNARRTHCLQGHELAGENLIVNKHGQRGCRTCKNRKMSEYHAKRRLVALRKDFDAWMVSPESKINTHDEWAWELWQAAVRSADKRRYQRNEDGKFVRAIIKEYE